MGSSAGKQAQWDKRHNPLRFLYFRTIAEQTAEVNRGAFRVKAFRLPWKIGQVSPSPNPRVKDRDLTKRGQAEQVRILAVGVKSNSIIKMYEVDMAERGVLRLALQFYRSFNSAMMPGHDHRRGCLVLRERRR